MLSPEEKREMVEWQDGSMDIVRRQETPDAEPFMHDSVLPALAAMRIAAKAHGYALGWHGSMARDIDVIAVPWTENASPADVLVGHIVKRTNGWIKPSDSCPSVRPHGRLAWSIHLIGTGTYVDLSVMPLATTPSRPHGGEGVGG